MKKLVLAATVFLLGLGAKAQTPLSISDFYLDYSAANFDDSLTLWQLRSNDNPLDSNDVSYAALAITGPLAGYTDPTDIPNSINEWPYFNGPITFDSLFAYVVHKNHSGLIDTIIFQLVALDNNQKPTNTVLYSNPIFTNQSLSDSNEVVRIKSIPNFTTTEGQAVGMTLKYFGAIEDTFKLQAGYVKDNNGNADPGMTQYKNSYIQIKPHYNSTVKTSSVTNYGGSPIKAQNWKLGAYISGDIIDEWPWDTTAIKETDYLNLITVSPNPAQNNLNINLGKLPMADIKVQITNTLGQVVNATTVKNAQEKLTLDIATLSTGIYFVQVQAFDGVKAFRLVKE